MFAVCEREREREYGENEKVIPPHLVIYSLYLCWTFRDSSRKIWGNKTYTLKYWTENKICGSFTQLDKLGKKELL